MNRLLAPILLSIVVAISSAAQADDFVRLHSRRIWKVAECRKEEKGYKVRACFAKDFCSKSYALKEHTCLKSVACGDDYLSLTKSGNQNRTVEAPFLFNLKAGSRDISVVIGDSKAKLSELEKAVPTEQRTRPIYFFILDRESSRSYSLASVGKTLPPDAPKAPTDSEVQLAIEDSLTKCPD